MKKIIKKLLLKVLNLKININELEEILVWQNIYNFEEPFPGFIKKKVLKNYSSKNVIWVETGTYEGYTAEFLSNISKFVHTIEPSKKYFDLSKERLSKFSNCKVYNETSESILEEILLEIPDGESICFWLDGHWSGGDTFKGTKDTPIEFELKTIEKFINKFSNFTILVDDFRLFDEKYEKKEIYPDKYFLIEWAAQNNLDWNITRDIFVVSNSINNHFL